MAASSNTNQINLTASNGIITVTGTVVLLKSEDLTLAAATTDEDGVSHAKVDYSNYGNYKALKVTDNAGATQYICSMVGVKNVYMGAAVNSDGFYKRYPIYQHPWEYSDTDYPLARTWETTDRTNSHIIFDGSLGGNNDAHTQFFKHNYNADLNADGTHTTIARPDLMKGAMVGDTLQMKFAHNQKIQLGRRDPGNKGNTDTYYDDGRMVELSGSSDIYEYVCTQLTLPDDDRVDGDDTVNATLTNDVGGIWSARPGFNKLLGGCVASTGAKRKIQFFIDAQNLGTSAPFSLGELGFTEDNFGTNTALIDFTYEKADGSTETEHMWADPNSPIYDLAGRVMGNYLSDVEFDPTDFPVRCQLGIYNCWDGNESLMDDPHQFSYISAAESGNQYTNPTIMANELESDPWCMDRQYSTECNLQVSNGLGPWHHYAMEIDYDGASTGGTGGTSARTVYKGTVVTSKIQYTGSIVKQGNIITKSESPVAGMSQFYRYKTKSYRLSQQDRYTMLRTVSINYSSNHPVVMFIESDDKEIRTVNFDATTSSTISTQPTYESVTKVVGIRCKTVSIVVQSYQPIVPHIDIKKITLGYG